MHFFVDKAHVSCYKLIMSKNKELNKPQEKPISVREWVKFCLRLKGYTLKSFGQEHGVTAGSVGTVFGRPYPRMEKLLADALGIEPWSLWPSRYGKDKKSNRPNLWYRRRRGPWKPKNIKKQTIVKGKFAPKRRGD
jgi:Ner family transcriptional regulator